MAVWDFGGEGMLLRDFWEGSFRPSCGALRECTVVGYESAWRCHIAPVLGDVALDALDVETLERWLAGIGSRGAARKAWAVLRTMLRKAVRWGVLDVDVTQRVTAPKRPDYQPRVHNARSLRELLKGFWGHPLEAWLICSATLGLRPEEALGLEWSDINLSSGHVSIERGLQWVNGHEVVVEPKTDLSRRVVVLPRFAVLRLRQLKGKGRLIGERNPGQVSREYASWCRREHLPFVPRQNLRHSWATTALAAGVDVAVVSRALGHSSIETTARYYLRPDLDVLKDAQRTWEKSIMAS